MKHTKETIIEALNVIKDVCQENDHCEDCPFLTEFGNCSFDKLCPTDIDSARIERNMQEG